MPLQSLSERDRARFWAKVNRPANEDECWLWLGAVGGGRIKYGRYFVGGGKTTQAHRAAFFFAFGWVPERGVVAHKCDVGLCVNPGHLVAMTQAENMRDCAAKGRIVNPRADANRAKTRCDNGHEYNESNTRWWRGERRCRACDRAHHGPEWMARRRERRRLQRNAANEPR